MRALSAFALLTCLFAGGAVADETVTLKGEVIDTACYLGHEARGPEHADCAASCIAKGMPPGLLLPDGNVYVLIGAHHDALNAELSKVAAKTIEATGKVAETAGMRALFVESWKLVGEDGRAAEKPRKASSEHGEHGHH